jgi:hypothetical protein
MRHIGILMIVLVAGTTAIAGQGRTAILYDFSRDTVGRPPKGFEFGHTAKVGRPGQWVVQADGKDQVLAQLDADRTGSRFPVAVMQEVSAVDVDLSVRFKPVSGRVDQAAGLVWRYQDENNYYIVRANALESNVVLYKVQAGKRTDLPLKGEGRTYGKKTPVPSGQWSTLRVVTTGPRFEVYANGNRLYEVEDGTFSGAGKVGVWTKADSVTYFDNLAVTPK